MGILELRYTLATEIGLVISIISLLVAMITFLIIAHKDNIAVRAHICIITALLVIGLFINQKDMENYIKTPRVEKMSVEFAKHDLIIAGFNGGDILILNSDAAPSDSSAEVQTQSVPGNKVVPKGTRITLDCKSDTYVGVYEENATISGVESDSSANGLSIIIEDYEFFDDGFYYKMPIDENSFNFVDFKRGISGHFSYSRNLTKQEYENWGHGGKILDAGGEDTNIDASFFSTSDGVFAVEFPEYMPKGDYVYLLYQFVNNEYCEARISFTIN